MRKTVITCDFCKKEIKAFDGDASYPFVLNHYNHEGDLCKRCFKSLCAVITGEASIVYNEKTTETEE